MSITHSSQAYVRYVTPPLPRRESEVEELHDPKFWQALYIQHPPGIPAKAIPSPSPASGLYIQARGGELTKVTIPPDCLAFQTGEALELATAGRLRATPHCVRVGAGTDAEYVSRETFALFMQPDVNQRISETETFGEFSKRIFNDHYDDANAP